MSSLDISTVMWIVDTLENMKNNKTETNIDSINLKIVQYYDHE